MLFRLQYPDQRRSVPFPEVHDVYRPFRFEPYIWNKDYKFLHLNGGVTVNILLRRSDLHEGVIVPARSGIKHVGNPSFAGLVGFAQ